MQMNEFFKNFFTQNNYNATHVTTTPYNQQEPTANQLKPASSDGEIIPVMFNIDTIHDKVCQDNTYMLPASDIEDDAINKILYKGIHPAVSLCTYIKSDDFNDNNMSNIIPNPKSYLANQCFILDVFTGNWIAGINNYIDPTNAQHLSKYIGENLTGVASAPNRPMFKIDKDR